MGYLQELRAQWRPLVAALIGLGCGFSMTNYVTSIMAPHFLREFGWSKSEFALIGSLGLVSVAFFPFVGRLTDMIGVRRTALIGVIVAPLAFLGLSQMTGDIRVYIALFLFQAVLCITTTTTVYSRTVVQYVTRARGLALAIVASGPAITGAVGGPILNNFVEAHGWRAGYLALVAFSAVAGTVALLMLPPERKDSGEVPPRAKTAKEDYATIFRMRAFWVLLGAMLLCNLPQVIALTQLNLVLLDNGVTAKGVSIMISTFATGVLVGRFASGLALDRFPAYLVAGIGMGFTAIGLFLLASRFDDPNVLMLSVLLIGLSFGAEGDVVGYLVVRNFGVSVFSSVMGMMTAAMAISASIGAALLSLTLKLTDSFEVFLLSSGTAVFLGSLLFLLLPRDPAPVTAAVAEARS
ncbi:MFS transporter [Sphingomonas cavernae]|uniref:MFS transporter n=1 Tax=Sphingomonas cavernae TaxID=2320861 RepID=A0A418WP81_9SPHN|nr:MFS transporter [Sphingomonas cavernae]RJF93046.1 MFS transporter [Sphingomonas cavernae]